MRRLGIGFVALAAVVLLATGAASADRGKQKKQTAGQGTTFTSFQLSATPGDVCPGQSSCTNIAAEPQIRADAAGTFFATSENGLGAGTVAWRSTDGGLHYQTLLSPNQGSQANETGFAPGGGDTDVAVAPVQNPQGHYNVYVASLSLANVDVSTSQDGGATWSLNPVTTPETVDDREWVAADGMQKVCISYHDAPQGITVGCSTNAGLTFTQWAPALDLSHQWQTANNEIGNLAIDPASHTIYQAYSSIADASEVVNGTLNSNYHSVWIAVSTDGGATFTDYPVYVNPDTSVQYGSQFVSIAVDRAGNVYAAFTDGHHVYESVSTTHGTSWSAPVQVDDAGTAIMPWVTAGDAGRVDVVYYQTPYADPSTTADNYPDSAAWTVGFAQNLAATSGGSFSRTAATPAVHYGGVCLSGVACTGNRDLYDDFGVAASPTTGMASIVYSDDQYDPNGPNSASCTASASNTSSCDHTSIATQTGGLRLFG